MIFENTVSKDAIPETMASTASLSMESTKKLDRDNAPEASGQAGPTPASAPATLESTESAQADASGKSPHKPQGSDVELAAEEKQSSTAEAKPDETNPSTSEIKSDEKKPSTRDAKTEKKTKTEQWIVSCPQGLAPIAGVAMSRLLTSGEFGAYRGDKKRRKDQVRLKVQVGTLEPRRGLW